MRHPIAAGWAQVALLTVALTAGALAVGELTSGEPSGFQTRTVARSACPDSRFECVTITVPRDHARPDGQIWEVTYAIQRAARERRGTFVTITGGPGTAGIASADAYADAMSPLITDHYDIVFLNQRGSGPFRPLQCPEAAATYHRTPLGLVGVAARDDTDATLRRFVDDCIDEGDIAVDDLPYYATRYAAADLELVRQHLAVDRLALYGESYGTQFVQTYAEAHPEHVAALILDGVVDLTVDASQWSDEAAGAHDDVLARTLDACADDVVCAADAGGDPMVAYDELSDRLAAGPVPYHMPLPDGSSEPRLLTTADLSIAAGANVGSFSARMHLLRVLNAAANDNLVPLARMALQYASTDPETLEVVADPWWSDALFFAVECQDYAFHPEGATERERLDRWLDDHVAGPNDELRLGDVALGGLPCLYWPAQPGETERPDPITDAPYPTFVLTADTDPATPTVSALRVFSRLDDAYLVTLQDGPHVVFGRGYGCVDDLIASYLYDGTAPLARVTICDGDLTDPYVPLAPDSPAELASLTDDPVHVAASIEEQLLHHVEYWLWWGTEPLRFGCDFGGRVGYEPTDVGTTIDLDRCELTDGYPVSGTATADELAGTFEMTATTPDGEIAYRRDSGQVALSGIWRGTAVDTTVADASP